MKGFFPTVTLGTARAPRVPCSARAVTIAGLGLGAIVRAVAVCSRTTAASRTRSVEAFITAVRGCRERKKTTVSKNNSLSVFYVRRYVTVLSCAKDHQNEDRTTNL